MKRSLVLHAHFYQPPREDPVLDEIEPESSAAPYHDWNQRIERECYRAVVAARVPAESGRIRKLVNTLESMSFNVGPTLWEWMEPHAPDTYRHMLAADRASCERFGGHGNAIAHPYHHVILPLASRRDKVTEVRWGISDFRRRFGREPEGMWLPETAVDDETLDVVAQEGIRFVILAPHQVNTIPPNGLPGRYTTTLGREIAICIYDGDLSHGIAFGGLVRDATLWWKAIENRGQTHRSQSRRSTPRKGGTERGAIAEEPAGGVSLTSAATDGETFGHHHKFAEMALAAVLERAGREGMRVENFASFLARHPPRHDVVLVAPSSWSCAHGVERWRSDCGCRFDGSLNPSQAWRGPLRESLDELAARLHELFESEGGRYFTDPWAARDGYGEIVSTSDGARRQAFLSRFLRAEVPGATRALELLEMERDAMRMFTSCAWFFDDIGGIESKQVLKYAARAAQLAGDIGAMDLLEQGLAAARSNSARIGTGAEVFRALPSPAVVTARVAGAAHTIGALGMNPESHLPAAFQASVDPSAVTLVTRRTGRATRFRTSLISQTPNSMCAEVLSTGPAGEASWQVCLADFPERARHAVRRALRESLLPLCLTSDELALLASGEVSLRGLVAGALTRSVERATTAEGIGMALAVVDLFEQLETNIPFDAQTAFWRLWSDPAGAPRDSLVVLGRRLGFADPEQDGSLRGPPTDAPGRA